MKTAVILSVDGKLVIDQGLLERFNISLDEKTSSDFEQAEELEVKILPIILGDQKRATLTGVPGAFLKIPVEFSLVSKRVKKGVCLLRYRRKVI